jgi:hypothetical protein
MKLKEKKTIFLRNLLRAFLFDLLARGYLSLGVEK